MAIIDLFPVLIFLFLVVIGTYLIGYGAGRTAKK